MLAKSIDKWAESSKESCWISFRRQRWHTCLLVPLHTFQPPSTLGLGFISLLRNSRCFLSGQPRHDMPKMILIKSVSCEITAALSRRCWLLEQYMLSHTHDAPEQLNYGRT